jgi:hypothetical protein
MRRSRAPAAGSRACRDRPPNVPPRLRPAPNPIQAAGRRRFAQRALRQPPGHEGRRSPHSAGADGPQDDGHGAPLLPPLAGAPARRRPAPERAPERGPNFAGASRGFASRAYQPPARLVYQPAILPSRGQRLARLPGSRATSVSTRREVGAAPLGNPPRRGPPIGGSRIPVWLVRRR